MTIDPSKIFITATDLVACYSGEEALSEIEKRYSASCKRLEKLYDFLLNQKGGDLNAIEQKRAYYPFLGIKVEPKNMGVDARFSYGVVRSPGVYGTSVTNPEVFANYYKEQIDLLVKHHKVPVYVGYSKETIPLPFAIENLMNDEIHEKLWQMNVSYALPDLSRVNDQIANNTTWPEPGNILPLSLFTAERVDYSLHRIIHYTGTHPKHFQNFILLTNYDRYVKEFIEYARHEIEHGKEYTELVGPGDTVIYSSDSQRGGGNIELPEHLPQMPTYHLKRPDNSGITFMNIGIGPSNAKNITDHLAVLRPHCWLMVGHCAGLRREQQLGDYVLAHAYVREDHVLNQDLPLSVPLPAIAEVQVALQDAVANITGQQGLELKTRMRTGTVLTTDNRNWELLSDEFFNVFKQTRAIAVDMESATIAANGFRFRVPYGTLLCVSDKPIHGELKLKTSASDFYRTRVKQHLKIGIETVKLIRENGVLSLHSRKLRGFEEPPLR